MKGKSLLIPIAAFAVTVTGAQAFNSEVLDMAGLSEEQKSAFEEARELREEGDREGARDVLIEAGIDEDTMDKVREAMHEYRDEHRAAIDEAVANNDYDAFKEAIAGSPLEEIIQNEDDFAIFVEAHDLRAAGEHDEAKALMDELGFMPPQDRESHGMGMDRGRGEPPFLSQLTDEQKEAFEVAKEANDKETMKAILEEAGIAVPDLGRHGHHRGHMMDDDEADS
ncbi:hypothetical protein H6783_03355 [Candidatus Nomurabacteria bacterium]|nr:hypothetical protein [Candidatus Nomurabacteria bacterium]